MMTLEVNCTVDRSKRTVWMKRLMCAFNNAKWKQYDGTQDEMKGIRSGIDCYIRQLKMSGQVSMELSTEMASNNVLLVKKNGKAFIMAQFV